MATTTDTLPCLDLTEDPKTLEQGSPEWKKMCTTLREVLEKHGGALVNFDTISSEQDMEKMFSVIPDLFALPVETKRKNDSKTPMLTYAEPTSTYEALGVEEAQLVENTRAFVQLMWPDGNDDFWQTMHSVISIMQELVGIITKMIFDSYGAGKHYESLADNIGSLFRMARYTPPPKGEPDLVLPAHTDHTFITVLCQNGVDGLEFKSKDGDWYDVNFSKRTFVIFAGHGLRAWSNERIFAVPHRVTLSGDKKRTSICLFCTPRDDYIVESPDELADGDYVSLSKPFSFAEFRENMLSNNFNGIADNEEKKHA